VSFEFFGSVNATMVFFSLIFVMAGLVPAISLRKALRP
jgi:hypothetical protein